MPLELLSVLAGLALWQLLATVFPHRLFPPPLAVTGEIWRLAAAGPLLADLGKTLTRVALGFSLAMVIGTALGIVVGRYRTVDRLASPWVTVGLNLPALVSAIALYIWLGLTETALILAVVINKLPLVVATVREGVRSLSAELDELARAYRLPLGRRLRIVLLPQLMPFLLAAARTGLALIWKIVLVFEVLGSDGGVGYRINLMFQFFDITGILAMTASFVAVVVAFDFFVLRILDRRMQRWRPVRA
ncbi:MAG TPA: ABC transporter permease subunit [Devosia sp.]